MTAVTSSKTIKTRSAILYSWLPMSFEGNLHPLLYSYVYKLYFSGWPLATSHYANPAQHNRVDNENNSTLTCNSGMLPTNGLVLNGGN